MQREIRGAIAHLYDCTDPEVLVEGRAGTAKTTGILTIILERARMFPGSRHLIVRATRTSLTESVLVTLERLLDEGGYDVRGNAQRLNRHDYPFGNGSVIVAGGLDKGDRYFSTEWDTVYVAEAIETGLDAWEKFGRAMRNGRMRDRRGRPFHQRIADCNPGPPGHWLNLRATPADDALRDAGEPAAYRRLQDYNRSRQSRRMRRLISVHQDNPGYWDNRRWRWTPAGRAYVMGELAHLSGHRKARLFDGRWRGAEGTVFPEFDEDRHVITPFRVPAEWPHAVLFDPGFDHPSATLVVAFAPNGCWYVVDEIHERELSPDKMMERLIAMNRAAGRTPFAWYADPRYAFSRTAMSPMTIAQQLAPYAFFQPWVCSSDETAMVENLRRRLIAGRIKVFAHCVKTVGEFQSWSYQRDAHGQPKPGQDKFEDKNNDALDCLKGLASTPIVLPTGVIDAAGRPGDRIKVYG